jgi:hypothetical protein
LLGVFVIGGKEEVEGSAIRNLSDEISTRAVRDVNVSAGCGLECLGDFGHDSLQIGGRGDFQRWMLSPHTWHERRKRKCEHAAH